MSLIVKVLEKSGISLLGGLIFLAFGALVGAAELVRCGKHKFADLVTKFHRLMNYEQEVSMMINLACLQQIFDRNRYCFLNPKDDDFEELMAVLRFLCRNYYPINRVNYRRACRLIAALAQFEERFDVAQNFAENAQNGGKYVSLTLPPLSARLCEDFARLMAQDQEILPVKCRSLQLWPIVQEAIHLAFCHHVWFVLISQEVKAIKVELEYNGARVWVGYESDPEKVCRELQDRVKQKMMALPRWDRPPIID